MVSISMELIICEVNYFKCIFFYLLGHITTPVKEKDLITGFLQDTFVQQSDNESSNLKPLLIGAFRYRTRWSTINNVLISLNLALCVFCG